MKTAKRAALLHDIGKAMTHEVEGSHALVSAQLARRYGESQGVVHAIEAHHYEVQPQTVEAVLLIAADAISASRPGARGESLEHYIKRLVVARGDRSREAGRREGLRAAGRPRDPRHRRADRGRRRRRRAALARDRPRDRGPARVPGPGQGDRDPREPRDRGGEVALGLRIDHCVIAVSDWERSNALLRATCSARRLIETRRGRSAYRFGDQQLNVHGPGTDAEPVAAVRVVPGGSDLCFVWAGTAAGRGRAPARPRRRARARAGRARRRAAGRGRACTSATRTAACSSSSTRRTATRDGRGCRRRRWIEAGHAPGRLADLEAIAALYAEDAVFYSHPFRERQAPREYAAGPSRIRPRRSAASASRSSRATVRRSTGGA